MRGVLLDVDGTLLDSNDAHARAWADALEGCGYYFALEIVRELIGKGGDKLLWELTGVDPRSRDGEHIALLKKLIFNARYLGEIGPFPCARELVLRMKESGLRLVVTTSAGREEVEGLLEAAFLEDLLDMRVTKDDVGGSSKPDPQIVEAAIECTLLPAREVILIGDTPYDVEAATRAHLPAIALRCGGFSDAELAGAVAIFDSPADLLAHYDESPLARAEAGR